MQALTTLTSYTSTTASNTSKPVSQSLHHLLLTPAGKLVVNPKSLLSVASPIITVITYITYITAQRVTMLPMLAYSSSCCTCYHNYGCRSSRGFTGEDSMILRGTRRSGSIRSIGPNLQLQGSQRVTYYTCQSMDFHLNGLNGLSVAAAASICYICMSKIA